MSRRATSRSSDSSPAASNQPTGKEKSAADNRAEVLRPKGVILVSEAFTEINAGLVIVLASGHENPIPISTLTDPDFLCLLSVLVCVRSQWAGLFTLSKFAWYHYL